MDAFYSIISIVGALLLPLFFVGGIVGIIVYFVKHKNQSMTFNLRTFLNMYFYFMIFLIIITGVVGISLVIKSSFSYFWGVPFSYSMTSPVPQSSPTDYISGSTTIVKVNGVDSLCYDTKSIVIDGKNYCFDTETQKRDMITGATIVISMIFLLAFHVIGLMLNTKVQSAVIIKKVYLFISLGIYGIATVIILPMSVYMLFDYFFNTTDISSYSRSIPGAPLSVAIAVLPLWIYYLIRTIKIRES